MAEKVQDQEPLPSAQRDVPPGLDPEIENHPIIKACKVLIEIHQTQIDLIQNGGQKLFRKNEVGEDEDVTAQVLGESVSNVNKANELMTKVRTEKVFTSPSVDLIRELDVYATENPFKGGPGAEKSITSQVVKIVDLVPQHAPQHLPESAEHAAEDPDVIVGLPEDR